MESITTTEEEYHNIRNELLELSSMPHIGEPDMILAEGEQWKSDVELPRKLLPGVPQYLSEHEMLAELATFFHLVSEGNVNI